MAASVLEAHGASLCRNSAGANLDSGIASALLEAGPGQVGLFEVDEAALTGVCASLEPSALVLGNLFRDQLDRYGELELIGERWRGLVTGLGAACTVAYNADDPLVAGVGVTRGPHSGSGSRTRRWRRERMQHAADSKWCSRCGHRLGYDAVFLGHLGHWRAPTAATRGRRRPWSRGRCASWGWRRASSCWSCPRARPRCGCRWAASTTSTTRWPRPPSATSTAWRPRRSPRASAGSRPPSAVASGSTWADGRRWCC